MVCIKYLIISDRPIYQTLNCPIPRSFWPNSCTTSCVSPTTTRMRSRPPRRTTLPTDSGRKNFRLKLNQLLFMASVSEMLNNLNNNKQSSPGLGNFLPAKYLYVACEHYSGSLNTSSQWLKHAELLLF
jgi:hypothetical protein